MAKRLVGIAVALAVCVTALPVCAVDHYTATPLGGLGGISSEGFGINNLGQVTGTAVTGAGVYRAFLYSGRTIYDLNTLVAGLNGAVLHDGNGINDAGHVVGDMFPFNHPFVHAFIYADGTVTDLDTLGGSESLGLGINGAGQVTGLSTSAGDSTTHAFLYSGGSMHDLGTLGGPVSAGLGINAKGDVTGFAETMNAQHAFIYSGGMMRDLGTLPGSVGSAGTGINDRGEITGYTLSGNSQFPLAAFIYTGGAMRTLGSLGGVGSAGYGINNIGQVTGYATLPNNAQHAFVYADGTMYDLNNLVVSDLKSTGVVLISARGINDKGQIIAYGCGVICEPYRLDPILAATPVPTVSGWALGAMAMLLVAAFYLRLRHGRRLTIPGQGS